MRDDGDLAFGDAARNQVLASAASVDDDVVCSSNRHVEARVLQKGDLLAIEWYRVVDGHDDQANTAHKTHRQGIEQRQDGPLHVHDRRAATVDMGYQANQIDDVRQAFGQTAQLVPFRGDSFDAAIEGDADIGDRDLGLLPLRNGRAAQ